MNATKAIPKYEKRIVKHLENSNGIITARSCREQGIPTIYLTRLTEKGVLRRMAPGIYGTESADFDELFFFQYRFSKSVFSYETAASLLGVSDKIINRMDVTVSEKYNFGNRLPNINIHYVKKEWLNLGVTSRKTVFGNPVRVYSYERTLCDVILNRDKVDPETYVKLIRGYSSYMERNLKELQEIANKMGVLQKVTDIMEIAYE
jgi:predicted transcriptional regulator of viral defense system